MASLAMAKPALSIKDGGPEFNAAAAASNWRVCATSNNFRGACQLIFFNGLGAKCVLNGERDVQDSIVVHGALPDHHAAGQFTGLMHGQ